MAEHTNTEKAIVTSAAVAGGAVGVGAGVAATASITATLGAGVAIASAPIALAVVGAYAVGKGVSSLIKWFNE